MIKMNVTRWGDSKVGVLSRAQRSISSSMSPHPQEVYVRLHGIARCCLPLGRIALGASLALSAPVIAQQSTTTISGVVKDETSGAPIPGVKVSVIGAPHAAATNEQGRYSIPGVSSGTYSLEARRIGYSLSRKDNVHVAGATVTVDFALNSTPLSLEAVTVSATVDPTSGIKAPFAVSKLDAEQMPVAALGAASAMLQGKIAGVSVIRAGGAPGAGSFVQLRTPSSPFHSNSPLYVVDGVLLSDNLFNGTLTTDFESLEIESIEVIKGAAAAALYGSRAAGGVISITTNRGKNIPLGHSQFTVNTQYGVDQISKQVPKLTHHYYKVNDKLQWVDATGAVVPRASRVIDDDGMIDNRYATTFDNIHQVFHPANVMITTLSLAQSSAATNLNISYDRNIQSGTEVEAQPFSRQTFRAAVDHSFRDNLNVSVTATHARTTQNPDQISYTNLWRFDPDVNLLWKNDDGSPFRVFPDSASSTTNPLYLQHYRDNHDRRVRSVISTNGLFRPLDWLSLTGDFGYDRSDRVRDNYTPPGLAADNNGGVTLGSLSYEEDEGDTYNGSVGATATHDFGGLNVRLTGKGESQRERALTFAASGSQFAIVGLRDLAAAATKTNSSSTADIRTNAGLADLGMNYNDRYILDVAFRHEGSSLFGPGHRYNDFYRAGASYLLSNEPWWGHVPGIISNNFTTAKLRYNVGTTGTRPNFADQYAVIRTTTAGLVRDDLGNPDLKPEKKFEQELGMDLIFKNRLSFIATYSRAKTTDAIVDVAVASATGFNTAEENVGKTLGETWEGTVEGAWVNRKNFRWSTNIVMDRSKSTVLAYDRPCFADGIRWRCDGVGINTFWGRRMSRGAGDLPTDATTQALKDQFQVNDEGYLVWVGAGNSWRDGVAKKLWNTSTRINNVTYRWGEPFMAPLRFASRDAFDQIGDGQSKYNFGVGNRFNYKQLQVYFLINGQIGGQIYNNLKQNNMATSDWYQMDQTGKSDETKKPYYYYTRGVAQNNSQFLDNFVESAGYAKFKELQVSYTMNASRLTALQRIGADRISLQLIGRDLYTWTRFTGLDPESGSNNSRVADPNYPIARNFTTSITLVF
jgi:TonB-linked SusC/RagA family outer membrane protein